MSRKGSNAFLILAAGLVSAASPPGSRTTLASAAPFIDRANADWTRAVVAGDADAMSSAYDVNGVLIATDGTATRGKAAVRQLFARRVREVKVLKAAIHTDGRAVHGPDDVYEWGTAWLTLRAGKTVRNESGRYFTVWHHRGNTWLITRNLDL